MSPYWRSEDGRITVVNADCRDVLPGIAPSSVALVLTDPPYGIRYSPGGGGKGWPKKTFTGDVVIAGDEVPFEPSHLLRFARLILFGANHFADRLPPSPSWIAWDKRDGHPSNHFGDCELVWTNLGGPSRVFSHLWNGAFRASEKGVPRQHPTQKPLALMTWLIEEHTEPGDLILDPYAGSGTTLVAAQMTGRRCLGIEIEERYCAVAVSRLRQGVLDFAAEGAAS